MTSAHKSTEAGFASCGAGLACAIKPIDRPLRTRPAFTKIEQHRGAHDGLRDDGDHAIGQVEFVLRRSGIRVARLPASVAEFLDHRPNARRGCHWTVLLITRSQLTPRVPRYGALGLTRLRPERRAAGRPFDQQVDYRITVVAENFAAFLAGLEADDLFV